MLWIAVLVGVVVFAAVVLIVIGMRKAVNQMGSWNYENRTRKGCRNRKFIRAIFV